MFLLVSAVTGRDNRSLDMLDNRCQGYDAAVAIATSDSRGNTRLMQNACYV
jgi:hypothetical protein